jgi:glucose-6-phosphate 1-epimerase
MTDSLNQRFSIANALGFEPGKGGLIKAVVSTPRSTGEMYLHGAHVAHFQPSGHAPVLFLSGESRFEPGKPIRGGVPICFPWFGPLEGRDTAPAHGFARTSLWEVQSTRRNADESVTIELVFSQPEDAKSFWPHAVRAVQRVTFGSTLKMEFSVFHVGGEPFMFEEALHTYFHVGDVRQVNVTGLAGTPYLDKTQAGKEVLEGSAPIKITAETDRVYLDTTATCEIADPVLQRRIIVQKHGSASTVLWNPWINKSRAMSDFGDDEWPGMLCIETCNVGRSAVKLATGESHTMLAEISVAALQQ